MTPASARLPLQNVSHLLALLWRGLRPDFVERHQPPELCALVPLPGEQSSRHYHPRQHGSEQSWPPGDQGPNGRRWSFQSLDQWRQLVDRRFQSHRQPRDAAKIYSGLSQRPP